MRRQLFFSLLAVLTVAVEAVAQDRDIIPFFEPSSVSTPLYDTKFLWFEGTVAPHFFILRSGSRPSGIENVHRWSLLLTPQIVARMTRERSSPVRTPSYMPRLDLQRIGNAHYRQDAVDVWAGHVSVGHYSNGQSGCLFKGQDKSADCQTVDPSYDSLKPADRINKEDGSFDTNYIGVGLDFRRSYIDRDGETSGDWTLGLQYQHEFRTNPALKPIYPQQRLDARVDYSWCGPKLLRRVEFATTLSVIDQPIGSAGWWSAQPQVTLFPFNKSDLGFFVRMYHGPDYYNLHFADPIRHSIQVGVEFEQDGFLKFKRR